ncbi:7570_t:CDS:1 [Diversispora eburnea]|uniref:7570_t:CDS:1 n=1 Tax=Diversispora eburnea TaxID=1213867 RepID=A0A9N9BJW4_9GLOM|nr:7570_t:CDS:1 [Diversispora eburnea]
MPRKKNKKCSQSVSSINTIAEQWLEEPTNPVSDKSQFTTTTCAVTATELQELLQQGVKLKKINQVLEYNRDNDPWIDNFIHLSMELEKQSKDPKEKAYHKLMREIFNTKMFYEASKQDRFESRAEYYKNKIEDCVFEYLSQVGENKKGWLSRGAVGTLRQVITSQKVLDLLDIAENKGLESPSQIII